MTESEPTDAGANGRTQLRTDGGSGATAETPADGKVGGGRTDAAGSDPAMVRAIRVHGLIGVLAAFVFWAPYVFTGDGSILLTGPLLGGAIVLLTAFNAYRGSVGESLLVPVSVLLFVLSAVAAASPFLLDVDAELVFGVTAVAGGLAALLSIYAIVASVRLRGR